MCTHVLVAKARICIQLKVSLLPVLSNCHVLTVFGWPFIKRFALCYQTVVCSVCPVSLFVCLWRWCIVASQLDGSVWNLAWIKMPLDTEVGLGPDDIVLDGDGESPSPIFGLRLLWPNGWMDQDGTCHGSGPWSRPYCARWGPSSPPQKGGQSPQFSAHFYCGQTAGCIKMPLGMALGLSPAPPAEEEAEPPIFGPRLLWPNGCIDQDATWYRGRPRPTRHCVRWGPSFPPLKWHAPNFRPMSVVAKWLDGVRCHLVWR